MTAYEDWVYVGQQKEFEVEYFSNPVSITIFTIHKFLTLPLI